MRPPGRSWGSEADYSPDASWSCSRRMISSFSSAPSLSSVRPLAPSRRAWLTYPQYLAMILRHGKGRPGRGELDEQFFLDSSTFMPLENAWRRRNSLTVVAIIGLEAVCVPLA